MNREIKFRAWDDTNKELIFPNDRHEPYKTALGIMIKHYGNLMQFTGQYDQDGTEIYEDDIIEFDKREWGGDGNIHLVSWDNDTAEWSWGGGCTSDMEYRKVIGNIYENQELLVNKI